MKKCLVLTTQYANNMGALLQCYALSSYINRLDGCECEVIDYYPPYHELSWAVFNRNLSFEGFLKNIYLIINPFKLIEKRKRNKLVKNFIANYINRTKQKYYSEEDFRNNYPEADVYICGSDQIWNMNLRDLGRKEYFLDFVKDGRKVAYAASIAEEWSEKQKEFAKNFLKDFSSISVREIEHVDIVQKLVPNIAVKHCIDPVFLLSPIEWSKIANSPQIDEPYILCYYIGVPLNGDQMIKKIKKVLGLKVVYLNVNMRSKIECDMEIRSFSPLDFVGYIKNAKFVCTNSFHCAAFSIIYKKDFITPIDKRSSRLRNLQHVFSLNSFFRTEEDLNNININNIKIDYSNCSSGESLINDSKKYIISSIFA